IEHLDDSLRHMLFDRDAGAEYARTLRRIEHDRDEIGFLSAFIQCITHLTHHCDVQDVERRPGESDARPTIVNRELDVWKFRRHFAWSKIPGRCVDLEF